MVVLNLDNRLPVKRGRVLNDIDLRFGATVEDNVEPVVLPQPLRRPVFVGRKSHLPDGHPALHLDEPNFDGGLPDLPGAGDEKSGRNRGYRPRRS